MNKMLERFSAGSAEDVAHSPAWHELTEADHARMASLAAIREQIAGQVIEALYVHNLGFQLAADASQDQVEQVKSVQKQHLVQMLSTGPDGSYIKQRRLADDEAEMTALSCSGTYGFYLNRLALIIKERHADDSRAALDLLISLQKVVFFNMTSTLQALADVDEDKIEGLQRQIAHEPMPVMRWKPGLIVVPVVGAFDGLRARNLTILLLTAVRDHHARVVVLDITDVAEIDSFIANQLIQTMLAARLMGATAILTGVSPQGVQLLAQLGMAEHRLAMELDLQSGIQAAEAILVA